MILYCQHGGTSLRLVYTVMPAPIAGKKSPEKQGGQLKGDNKKPIVAMAPHPSGAVLCIHSYCIISDSHLILQVFGVSSIVCLHIQPLGGALTCCILCPLGQTKAATVSKYSPQRLHAEAAVPCCLCRSCLAAGLLSYTAYLVWLKATAILPNLP